MYVLNFPTYHYVTSEDLKNIEDFTQKLLIGVATSPSVELVECNVSSRHIFWLSFDNKDLIFTLEVIFCNLCDAVCTCRLFNGYFLIFCEGLTLNASAPHLYWSSKLISDWSYKNIFYYLMCFYLYIG